MLHAKDFDLVIFGATGFTGRLISQYLLQKHTASANDTPTLKIAIAGRNAQQLAIVAASCDIKPAVLIADASNPASIAAMVEKTRVVLNMAGPYALFGEPVIAACAKHGVDYLDITGETPFIRRMIIQYQEEALATGARLIPFSGFDSVPADLCVYLALKIAQQRSLPIDEMCLYYQIKGGFNGGTLATALNMADTASSKDLLNANSLIPELPWAKLPSTSKKPLYVSRLKRFSVPFFMSPINTSVVRRSLWLQAREHDNATHGGHQDNLRQSLAIDYSERMLMSRDGGQLKAWLTCAMLLGFKALSARRVGRKLIRKLGPQPGEGPSVEMRQSGFFRGQLVARYKGRDQLSVTMARAGDPGNTITIILAAELARLTAAHAFVTERKGFLTPTVAFGERLREQLVTVGFHIATEIYD